MWDTNNQYTFNEDFQVKILALMVQDSSFLVGHIDIIHPSYFTALIFQNISRLVIEFFNSYSCLPTKDSLVQLVVDYLTQSKLDTQAESYDIMIDALYTLELPDREYVISKVVSFGKTKAIENAMLKCLPELQAGDFDKVQSLLSESFNVGLNFNEMGYDYLDNMEQRMKDLHVEKERGIPTGFPELDRFIKNGGLCSGEVGFVMAPTSHGKSIFLANVATSSMVLGKKVLYCTFEMQDVPISLRVDSILSGTSVKDLTADWDTLKAKKQILTVGGGKLKVFWQPTDTCSTHHIMAYIDKLKKVYNFVPDLLIIDYADIMRPTVMSREKRDNQGQIFKDIVSLAQNLRIPVWTASQSNRAGYSAKTSGENIGTEHSSESITKAQVADLILSLIIEDKYDDGTGVGRIHIAKQRDGAQGLTLGVDLDFKTYKLTVNNKRAAKVKAEAESKQAVDKFFNKKEGVKNE